MKAIILAAGMGTRLGKYTENLPKCMLNFNGKPVLIDFSQATVVRTPNSEELLERDVRNLVHFFKKLGLKIEEEKVYKKITG